MLLLLLLALQDPAAPVVEEPIDCPAPAGSCAPNLTGDSGRLVLSWIEPVAGGHALRLAMREAGKAWSKAGTVAEGRDWFVNWADIPSIALLREGGMAAHWLQKSGSGTFDYDVRLSLSRDGGKTWGASIVPHRDGVKTEHGFVSLVPQGDGAAAVWLDGRALDVREGVPKGSMRLMHTTVSASGKLGEETVLDERVCECCSTAAAAVEGGMIVVYRDRGEGEIRDISIVRLRDGAWSKARPVHRDGWEVHG